MASRSILLSGGYLFREYVSRLTLVHFGLLLLAGFVLIRIAAYHLMRSRSKNGSARRAVIVGRGRLARELARKIRGHPEMLCNVVGFLEPDDGTWDSGAVRAATGTAAAVVFGMAQAGPSSPGEACTESTSPSTMPGVHSASRF